MQSPNDYISTKEASEYTGYHPDYLSGLCRSGKIQGLKVGKVWLVSKNSLNEFVGVVSGTSESLKSRTENQEVPETLSSRRFRNAISEKVKYQDELINSLRNKISELEQNVEIKDVKVKPTPEVVPTKYSHPLVPSRQANAINDAHTKQESFKVSTYFPKRKTNLVSKIALPLISVLSLAVVSVVFVVLGNLNSDLVSSGSLPTRVTTIVNNFVNSEDNKKVDSLIDWEKVFGIDKSKEENASTENEGKVLGQSIAATYNRPIQVTEDYLKSFVDDYIKILFDNGTLPDPLKAGLQSQNSNSQPVSQTPASLQTVNPSGTPSNNFVPVYIPVGVAPANPGIGSNGSSLFSATNVSADRFVGKNLEVSETATLKNLTVTGSISGNVSGIVNPGFTNGAIAFQGPSGLAQDAANLFWEDTGNALGIGTNTPAVSALLDITSSSRGVLMPRMTAAQRDLIATPSVGLTIFNTDSNRYNFYDGTSWVVIAAGALSASLSSVTAASADSTIANSANNIVWNWSLTGAETGMVFGESAASTGGSNNQHVLKASTLTSSTAMPLFVENLGDGRSFQVSDQTGDTSPFVIDASGNVGIGTTTPTAKLDVINSSPGGNGSSGTYIANTVTGALNNNYNAVGSLTEAYLNTAANSGSNTSLIGATFLADVLSTGSVSNIYGSQSVAYLDGAATVTNLVGVDSNAGSYAGTVTNVTGGRFQASRVGGTVTNLTGVDILSSTGAATNVYGLKVGDLTTGTNNYGISLSQTAGANNYAIYSSGTAKSYFAGNVGIGTTSPNYPLEVNGFIRAGTTGSYGTRIFGDSSGGFVAFGTIASPTSLGQMGPYSGLFNIDSGNNSISFKFSGTERARIDSLTGNLGIGTTAPDGRLEIAGNLSASAWGLNGIQLQGTAAIYTDTSSSGTVTNAVASSFGQPTFAASSATTYTNAASLYIANAPAAGTNVTLTNPYALWVDDGNVRFDGNLSVSGSVTGTINPSFTTGSVVFQGASGLAQDNANFFWDDTNNRLGIGTTTPGSILELRGTSPSLTLNNAGSSGSIMNTSGAMLMTTPSGGNGFQVATPSVIFQVRNDGGVVLGTGENSASPVGKILRAPSAAGTNIAGGTLTIQGGQGTGSANGGSIIFQTSNQGTSGSAVGTLATAFTISPPATGTTALVNGITLTGAITGSSPIFSATGSDSNIGIKLTPKGTGNVSITGSTGTANGVTALSVTDASTGTFRLSFTNSGAIQFSSHGVSSGQSLVFGGKDGDTSAFTELFRIDNTNGRSYFSNGNVGIGTTGPAGLLHIGTAGTRGILMNNSTIGTASTDGTYLTNTTDGNFGIVNQEVGAVRFAANNTYQLALGSNGGLALGPTYYNTDPGAGKMIIESNVGIGTTSPSAKLDVFNTAGTATAIYIGQTQSGGSRPSLSMSSNSVALGLDGTVNPATSPFFFDYSGSTAINSGINGTTISSNHASGKVIMNVNGEIARFTSSGLGVGTSVPGAKLHVASNSIGSTSTDGFILENQTAATLGQQQWSPRIRLTGQGWRTNATAGTRILDWIMENQTISGANSGVGSLVWSYQTSNVPGYNQKLAIIPSDTDGTGTIIAVDGASPSIRIKSTSEANGLIIGATAGGARYIQSYESQPLHINTAGNNVIFNSSGGNVAIGTTTASWKLTVSGDLRVATGSTPSLYASNGQVGLGTDSFSAGYTARITNAGTGNIILNGASGGGGVIHGEINDTINDTGVAVGTSSTVSNARLFEVRNNTTVRFGVNNNGDVYVGNGNVASSPAAGLIKGTGGSGSNIAGAALQLAGGIGTGTGVGGNIMLQYAPAGVAGATSNSLLTACTLSGTNGSLSCPGAGGSSERFGSASTAAGANSIAIGNSAAATSGNAIVIGKSSSISYGNGWIIIGQDNALAPSSGGGNGIFIGRQLSLNATNLANSVTIGDLARADGSSVTIGQGALGDDYAVTIGQAAAASNSGSVVVGYNATGGTGSTVVIGNTASGGTNGGVVIGASASSGDQLGVAIGNNASVPAGSYGSIAIGWQSTTAGQNQFVAGSNNNAISNVFFGKGVTNATPTAYTINGTGGSGTDIAGGALQLAGGKATGNAAGGDILFQTSNALASGSTLQSLTTKMIIKTNGNIGIGTTDPQTKLDIQTDAGGNGIIVRNSGTDYFTLQSGGVQKGIVGTGALPFYLNNASGLVGIQTGAGNVVIGTTTASAKLHVLSTTEQLRLGYDASNYSSFTVGSTGALTLAQTGTGGAINITSSRASGGTTNSAFNIKTTTDLGASDELVQLGDSAADFFTLYGNGQIALGAVNVGSGNTGVSVNTNFNSVFGINNTDNVANAGNRNTIAGFGNIFSGNTGTNNNSIFGSQNSVSAGVLHAQGTVVGYGNSLTAATNGNIFGNGITNGTDNSVMIGPSDAAKITILSSGNLGVGTANPGEKLVVASGNARLSKAYGLQWNDANDEIRVEDTPSWLSSKSNVMTFETYDGAWVYRNTDASNIAMTIVGSSGYVGIGTTAPSEYLDVRGGNILIGKRTDGTTDWAKVSQSTAGTIAASGTANIDGAWSAAVFNGSLYVGTYETAGSEVYRYDGGTTWTKVSQSTAGTIAASGTASIDSISSMVVYNGALYIGTEKTGEAEVYRYDGGTTWTKVSQSTSGTIAASGTAAIDIVSSMAVVNGVLYAGTYKSNSAEVYRYDGGTTWTKVSQATAGTIASGGTASIDNVASMVSYNGSLYVGTEEGTSAEIYRYDGGTTWTKVSAVTAGTISTGGTASIVAVYGMAIYNGSLIAGTYKANSAEIYRYDGSAGNWTKISQSSAGTIASGGTANIDAVWSFSIYNGSLYAGTQESASAEIYRYDGDTTWTKVSQSTAGTIVASGTSSIVSVFFMIPYNNDLYAGTQKSDAGEVVRYITNEGQSYALKFNAASDNANAEQNGLLNIGQISFAGEQNVGGFAGQVNTGTFLFSHAITTSFGGYDLAEDYPTRDTNLSAGDIVMTDTENGLVTKATGAYNSKIVGVYSSQPALRLSQRGQSIDGLPVVPVALVGRVPVKVTNENGPIRPGDFLTVSTTKPGYAMKATRSGQVIGKALASFGVLTNFRASEEIITEELSGEVLVYVDPGFQMIGNTFVMEAEDATQILGEENGGVKTAGMTAMLIDQKGSGNILQMQANGVDRIIFDNAGNLAIQADNKCEAVKRNEVFAPRGLGGEIPCADLLRVVNQEKLAFRITPFGDVQFGGRVLVSKDTAGSAKINAGDSEVRINFENPYPFPPRVVITVQGVPNFFYGVVNKDGTGFSIKTSMPVEVVTEFDWIALAQPDDVQSVSSKMLNEKIDVLGSILEERSSEAVNNPNNEPVELINPETVIQEEVKIPPVSNLSSEEVANAENKTN